MAKSKTPAKRARRAEANRLRNKSYKSRLKTAINKYESLLAAADTEAAQGSLLQVTSLIDRSVNKGIMHKNTAARKKSALTRKYNALVK
ncbi:MAG: 30S ribosomal protein S20 [Syntrophomonadaceae bacterium]|nr:30S ribosomal protein S20 [Syntrophomonadaceae bacterium]